MKKMSLLASILGLFQPSRADVTFTSTPPIDIRREIESIAAAENSAGKVGAAGERGRLQFTATRWYELSHKPHRWAGWRHPFALAETERVEHEHIQDLIARCQKIRIVPTAYTIALMHTAGEEAVRTRSASAFKKDFAQRVENLYYASTP